MSCLVPVRSIPEEITFSLRCPWWTAACHARFFISNGDILITASKRKGTPPSTATIVRGGLESSSWCEFDLVSSGVALNRLSCGCKPGTLQKKERSVKVFGCKTS